MGCIPLMPDFLDRLDGAERLVEERARQATAALAAVPIPYGVIGALAVADWVRRVDAGAVRNTPNVDLLVRRSDADAVRAALVGTGFVNSSDSDRPAVYLDGKNCSRRSAVQVWYSGDVIGQSSEPLPDVLFTLPTVPYRVARRPALVRMKLAAFRRIDQVHLIDMIRVGLLDASWPDRFPPPLSDRLRELLADPEAQPGI